MQPTDTQAGIIITPAIRVTAQDAAGNTVTYYTENISIDFTTPPGGSTTLSGTKTVAASAGVATFSDLNINSPGNGYTLTANGSLTPLTPATSAAFNIFTAAAKIAFTVQPSNTTAGVSIIPAVQVTVEDSAGIKVTSSTASITLALGNNPSGGSLGGYTIPVTVNAIAGVATFSNLSINKAGTGYTLVASSGSFNATSTGFNISVGTANKLAFTVQPSNALINASIAPPVQVTVQDAVGNTVTSSTDPITLALGNNPSGGSLGGYTIPVTVNAIAGVATFSNLSINSPGIGYTLIATSGSLTSATSTAFNIIGPATKLAFTVQPPTNPAANTPITPVVKVTIQDAVGNTVTSYNTLITLTMVTNPNGGNLTGNTASPVSGVATFNSLSFNIPGTGYALNASTVSTPAVTSATSTNFNVFGPAAKLAFTVQPPTSTAAGAIITPAITVTVQDGGGYTVANSTDIISMSIGTNPAAGNLGGTISVAASSGVAAFNNLTIDKPGTGYTLIATDNLLATPTVTSNLFNVVSGAITVSSISPNFGPIAGGTPVTITGTGFVSSGLTVTIGGITAKNITLVSTTSITATTPAFATTGAQNVVVTTTGGSATLSNGFTYTLNWWGGDSYGAYHYRSLLTITNNTASVLAPYETKIIVTNNGHMNSNFSDVRFIANDNTAINNTAPVLYYWINPMPNPLLPSNEAEFWVNIPSIPAMPVQLRSTCIMEIRLLLPLAIFTVPSYLAMILKIQQ